MNDEQSKQLLATIARSAQRGANVVKQVLSFARGIEGDRQDVQIKTVLEEVLGIIRETFPKSIDVSLQVPGDLWVIAGNATQLHQVVLNLCVNARDAMPDGGKLTISARNVQLDEAYVRTHLDAKPIAYVVVEVDDTGTGMSPEILDKIFDPFFTTKDPGKGTGLGLSTTLSIVKGHLGFINVYSSPAGGAASRSTSLPRSRRRGWCRRRRCRASPWGRGSSCSSSTTRKRCGRRRNGLWSVTDIA